MFFSWGKKIISPGRQWNAWPKVSSSSGKATGTGVPRQHSAGCCPSWPLKTSLPTHSLPLPAASKVPCNKVWERSSPGLPIARTTERGREAALRYSELAHPSVTFSRALLCRGGLGASLTSYALAPGGRSNTWAGSRSIHFLAIHKDTTCNCRSRHMLSLHLRRKMLG